MLLSGQAGALESRRPGYLKPVEFADFLNVGYDRLHSAVMKSNLVDSKQRATCVKCIAMSLYSIDIGRPHFFVGIESINFVLFIWKLSSIQSDEDGAVGTEKMIGVLMYLPFQPSHGMHLCQRKVVRWDLARTRNFVLR